MATTYEPIATTTLGSATSTITFSSIAANWTDLRLIMTVLGPGTNNELRLKFNNSGSGLGLYSYTFIYGDGTSAVSSYNTDNDYLQISALIAVANSTIPTLITVDIFSYANSTYKTVLYDDSNTATNGSICKQVGLYRSTTAITEVNIISPATMATGTTATLYGIKAA